MVAVFVHGVPETPAVWGPVVDALGSTDTEALQLPGFGWAVPDGFVPDMHSYAAWLRSALDDIAAPIDLVGHDWGALLTLRVVADRHRAVRSWVTDGGDLSPDYDWHDLAKAWQTPGLGATRSTTSRSRRWSCTHATTRSTTTMRFELRPLASEQRSPRSTPATGG